MARTAGRGGGTADEDVVVEALAVGADADADAGGDADADAAPTFADEAPATDVTDAGVGGASAAGRDR
jgi:hypothetical protein